MVPEKMLFQPRGWSHFSFHIRKLMENNLAYLNEYLCFIWIIYHTGAFPVYLSLCVCSRSGLVGEDVESHLCALLLDVLDKKGDLHRASDLHSTHYSTECSTQFSTQKTSPVSWPCSPGPGNPWGCSWSRCSGWPMPWWGWGATLTTIKGID